MAYSVETIEPQPVAGIRVHTTMEEIGQKIGALIPEIMVHVGARAAGPVLARYYTWSQDVGEMEVAVPVREPGESTERVTESVLPGGRAAIAVHVGPYDTLRHTWEALAVWMKEQGLEGSDAPWEVYVSDCSVTPPEKLETRIVWPVAG